MKIKLSPLIRKLSALLALLLCLTCLNGCLYADLRVPMDDDLDHTVMGNKSGSSSSQSLFWLFAWGDSGIAAAARNGGLKTLHHADQDIYSVLFGLYSRRTTIVYGD